MRTYIVQVGDTPASIAAQDAMAGCPKCAVDLIRANPHKPTRMHANGYRTFREMTVGERLRLPEKWFNGALDGLPKAYFVGLSHHDGVTGLGDYPTLDQAITQVSILDTMDDITFNLSAGVVADLIDMSISGVGTSTAAASATFAKDTHTSTSWARQRNMDMADAITARNIEAAASARYDVRNALTTALGSARLCLQAYYGGVVSTPSMPAPAPAPAPTKPAPAPTPAPTPIVQTTAAKPGISTAGVVGIGLVAAGAAGAAYYYLKPRGRRVRRVHA